ncbi:MAG: hypothetical protein J6Q53_04885 [Oscillospiraceae bacterium]|nr:hypothetical protein [Oscillospiraceae bacterium]
MSKAVPMHGFGSGGALLNFNVVGGTTAPEYPRENMIWVNTPNKITRWLFSADEPQNLTEGMVWFKTGVTGSVGFNALKNNEIQIYPLFVKQYASDALAERTGKIYQNNAWRDFSLCLYDSGDEFVDITGGWAAYAYKSSGFSDYASRSPGVTKNDSSITLSQVKHQWENDRNVRRSGALFCENAIDLTGRSVLKINIEQCDTENVGRLGITSVKKDGFTPIGEVSITGVGEFLLDIPENTGAVYVYIAMNGVSSEASLSFNAVRAQ